MSHIPKVMNAFAQLVTENRFVTTFWCNLSEVILNFCVILINAMRGNYSITEGLTGIDEAEQIMERNKRCLQNARSSSLCIAWIGTLRDRGLLSRVPKDVIGMIAKMVWEIAGTKCWCWEEREEEEK